MTTMTKLADTLSESRLEAELAERLDAAKGLPTHQKQALLTGMQLVKQAEAEGAIEAQTPVARFDMAMELVKAAAITGDETFQKEAANAFAAGQLAGVLLNEAINKAQG